MAWVIVGVLFLCKFPGLVASTIISPYTVAVKIKFTFRDRATIVLRSCNDSSKIVPLLRNLS